MGGMVEVDSKDESDMLPCKCNAGKLAKAVWLAGTAEARAKKVLADYRTNNQTEEKTCKCDGMGMVYVTDVAQDSPDSARSLIVMTPCAVKGCKAGKYVKDINRAFAEGPEALKKARCDLVDFRAKVQTGKEKKCDKCQGRGEDYRRRLVARPMSELSGGRLMERIVREEQ